MYSTLFFRHVATAALFASAAISLHAQTAATFASGLSNPSRVLVGPNGTLLVTEASTVVDSGRISLLDTGGNRRTLLDGLPAGASAPSGDPDGPNGLALTGRTLYIANGEGDTHVSGPTQGTIVPNPAGPSSPMFATILQVNFSNDIDQLATGFSLQPQDHFTLMDGATLTLQNASGDTATVNVLAYLRVDRPDPVTIYRNTHLYNLTLMDTQPNTLYAVDAGNNAIWSVDLTSGRTQLLTRFPNAPDPIAPKGPPTSEAVPTSAHPIGNQLLVTLLTGVPFVPGASSVVSVDPSTGQISPYITLLSSGIDSVNRTKADGTTQWFVLEYSLASLEAPKTAPGRLLSYNPAVQTVLDGLNTPTSMALDPSTSNLYIVDRTDGTVLLFNVGN